MHPNLNNKRKLVLTVTIVISALGYFVDMYDMLLFSVVRSKSLADLGVPAADLLSVGISMLNWMVAGLLSGGVLWGILGDKRGRLNALFLCILTYSLANLANGFVTSVEQYKICRFIAGFGLAGELGASVTLVSELMTPKRRGYGTMAIAAIGMLGAVCAAFAGQGFGWKTAYIIGGVLGFAILLLRLSVFESPLYLASLNEKKNQRGNFFLLFTNRRLFGKYISAIFISLPVYVITGILVTFAPEFGKAIGMANLPSAGIAIVTCFIAIAITDIICSAVSQQLKSRKVPIFIFLIIGLGATFLFLFIKPQSLSGFYGRCAFLGTGLGFWAVFMTHVAEQFGTNLRATVTTTVPNFSRGLLIPLLFVFQLLNASIGIINSAAIISIGSIIIAFIALHFREETFGRSLEFLEESNPGF